MEHLVDQIAEEVKGGSNSSKMKMRISKRTGSYL